MAARKKTQTVSLGDGYANVLANLATERDKANGGMYTGFMYDPIQLLASYQTSWLAAKTVDAPAEDATRKWRQWRTDQSNIDKLEDLEKKLKLKQRLHEALIAARLWGGAAIYINQQDRNQDKPLNVAREVKSLVVLTRNELMPEAIVTDINSEYFGRPEYYSLQTTGNAPVKIHASRLVVLAGRMQPKGAVQSAESSWGMSVLSSAMDAIKQLDSVMANVCSLVFEAKVDVFKFKDWASMLSNPANDAMLTRRLSLQATQKSINGAVVIDAEDDYEPKSASFGGLPDVITKFAENYSGATGIPFSRVYGRAAAGLSGSGEGDERTYYDSINHMQTEYGEDMSLLDECIITQALGSRPSDLYYEWRPLRQLTESERAEIFSKTANGLRALAGTAAGAVVPLDALSDAAVNEFIEQGMLPGLQTAIEKYGSLNEQEGLGDEIP